MSSGGISEEQALSRLQELGYEVKKPATFRKHTFEVAEDVFHKFRKTQEALGIRVKDAMNIALTDWIDKHGKDAKG